MVTQKPISLKIDYKLLQDLDGECLVTAQKRNGHINRAIRQYLELKDFRRSYKCIDGLDKRRRILERWLQEYFPEAYYDIRS